MNAFGRFQPSQLSRDGAPGVGDGDRRRELGPVCISDLEAAVDIVRHVQETTDGECYSKEGFDGENGITESASAETHTIAVKPQRRHTFKLGYADQNSNNTRT